jgi:hypothetical protein
MNLSYNDIQRIVAEWYDRLPSGEDDGPIRMKKSFRLWCESQGLRYPATVMVLMRIVEGIGGIDDPNGSQALRAVFGDPSNLSPEGDTSLYGRANEAFGQMRRLFADLPNDYFS